MSGSGSGEWRPVVPPRPDKQTRSDSSDPNGGAPTDACDITEVTTLSSPNRMIVSTLRVGDILDLELRLGPPRQLLAKRGDQVAGSITSPKSAQIIQCISREGRAYVAVVRTIRSGLCNVEIQSR